MNHRTSDASRPRTAQGIMSMDSPSHRLAVEASLLKASLPSPGGLSQLTKSAVRFDDAKSLAAKDSFKKQKQAWDSQPDTPHLSNTSMSPFRSSNQTGIKKIQDFLYPEHLRELRRRFENAPLYMKNKMDLDSFIDFFRSLPEMKGKSDLEIKAFFDKIDCYSEGKIDWDEFCTYMYLELYEKEDAKSKAKEVVFSLPSVPIAGPHKESLCSISHLQDGTLVSCSQDGVVCFWTHDLKPKRVRKAETGILGKPKWISDMAIAVPQGKVILATGDNEILFLEMINFEPYCQISNLDNTPLKLDFWSNPHNNSECLILIGDDQGCITIISISNIFETFKLMKLGPKKHNIPSFPIEGFVHGENAAGVKVYRWHIHSSWVTNVKYFGKLRVFVSTSNDSNASLVMGTPAGSTPVDAILHQRTRRALSTKLDSSNGGVRSRLSSAVGVRHFSNVPAKRRLHGDQRIFRVSKGVTTFDYCQLNNVLVTGGLDQIIYIWNPYVSERAIGVLYGQSSPIYSIQLDSANNRIYSVSNDNTIKVWDLVEQTCLSTVSAATHKVYTIVEALHFNTVRQYLVVGTDQLHILHLSVLGGTPKANAVQTHRLPISSLSYTYSFGLIVTACDESVVKVWDAITGECVFEFASVHGSSPITAIDIDQSGRRLVTAAQNGEIKIWNFNNGHCLLSLDKGNNCEVTAVKFISINQLKYVIAVGWDRSINVFFDNFEPGEVHSSITPIAGWTKSSSRGHKEDITSITMCHSTTLATASFDGEIILWNMISGQLIQRMHAQTGQLKIGDCVIHKLLFLHTRRRMRSAASLVASGPAGFVHFWNTYDTQKPTGYFQATQFKCLTDMVVNSANTILITADIEGFIAQWDITQFCIENMKTTKCLRKWRCHANTINSIRHIEEWSVLVTASSDCSVRVWTQEGHYIGTLGQKKSWNINNTSTYEHPLTPKDVLFDPLTIPNVTGIELEKHEEISLLQQRIPLISDLETDSLEEEKNDKTILAAYGLSYEVPRLNSPDIEGKRLRHLRSNSAKSSYRAPTGSYASLLYQELEKEPHFRTLTSGTH